MIKKVVSSTSLWKEEAGNISTIENKPVVLAASESADAPLIIKDSTGLIELLKVRKETATATPHKLTGLWEHDLNFISNGEGDLLYRIRKTLGDNVIEIYEGGTANTTKILFYLSATKFLELTASTGFKFGDASNYCNIKADGSLEILDSSGNTASLSATELSFNRVVPSYESVFRNYSSHDGLSSGMSLQQLIPNGSGVYRVGYYVWPRNSYINFNYKLPSQWKAGTNIAAYLLCTVVDATYSIADLSFYTEYAWHPRNATPDATMTTLATVTVPRPFVQNKHIVVELGSISGLNKTADDILLTTNVHNSSNTVYVCLIGILLLFESTK